MSQFDNTFNKTPEIDSPEKLSEVKPIKESRGRLVTERSQLAQLVETPLLEACEILYDKNIRTTETTANAEDINYSKKVGIVIDFDNLSPENQEIARELCRVESHPDGYTAAVIEVPVNESTEVPEIKAKAESIAKKFKSQPLTWSPERTLQEMRIIYGIEADDENYSPESFLNPKRKLFYDKETKLFYASKEHFKK